ncbi:acyl-CoA desaturase [Leucobacter sp. cx-42]|uniref:fatty acid desaturase family protein n=1 Tax=Leucobacter sp. cx-42 TaxID=2770547 RepID=UPI00165E3F76|nr:acyl-CoA desaturase [Leucobacter sp. cx-42]
MGSYISNILADDVSTLGPLRKTFARKEDFPHIARAYTRLSQEIRQLGLLSRSPWFYILTGFSIFLGFLLVLAASIILGESWLQLIVAACLGLLFTQVAFLAHEAGHRQILTAGPSNDALARVLTAFVGISYSWWDSKHSRHHANPNMEGKDPDIEVDTISFLQQDAASATGLRKFITKRQGWLFFPLLTLEGLNLYGHSFRYLLTEKSVKSRWSELSMIFIRTILVFVPIFVFLPLGMAFAFSGIMLAVFGIYMGASFAPNHKGMPVIAAGERIDFFTKQVRTSRNIRGGWWATIFMGGLNYQIEHHLFPSMARPKLAKARLIVQRFCLEHDVPYVETSLIGSYAIVIRYLNEVGLAARDPFECPMVAEFRRA